MFGKSKNKNTNQTDSRRSSLGQKPVFSYYARAASTNDKNTGRGEDVSRKTKRRNFRMRYHHIPSYLALAVIGFSVIYSCLLQPTPKIVLLNTPGTIARDTVTYQGSIQTLWEKSIFNRSKLTISTGSLRRDIESQFNELAAASVELPLLGKRATVVLTPASPVLKLVSRNGVFYVNSDGKVMARASEVKENNIIDLPLVKDGSDIAAEPGANILSAPEVKLLTELYHQLHSGNIAIESISLPKDAAHQADIRIVGQAYYIKFSTDRDARQAVGTYLAAKAKLESEGAVPTEYMDVRVEEKVFYK